MKTVLSENNNSYSDGKKENSSRPNEKLDTISSSARKRKNTALPDRKKNNMPLSDEKESRTAPAKDKKGNISFSASKEETAGPLTGRKKHASIPAEKKEEIRPPVSNNKVGTISVSDEKKGNSARPDGLKKRKLIDLPVSVAQTLGVLAVRENMSLKAFIEHLLTKAAEQVKEEEILFRLSEISGRSHTITAEETEQVIRYLREIKKIKMRQ